MESDFFVLSFDDESGVYLNVYKARSFRDLIIKLIELYTDSDIDDDFFDKPLGEVTAADCKEWMDNFDVSDGYVPFLKIYKGKRLLYVNSSYEERFPEAASC